LLLGRIDAAEVAREAAAQVERLQRAGIAVTHLDTHKHVHVFPAIARPLLQVAERCGVGAMRNPFEPEWSFGLGHGGWQRRLSLRLIGSLRSRFVELPSIREGRVRTTDGTAAISATGQLNSTTLGEILRALPASGTYEICCHPGYNDSDLDRVRTRLRGEREVERTALLGEVPRGIIQNDASLPGSPALIHYGNLAP
jgi:predicted glycoside hydrolase/deacetylase ChbG (UPF0249 family)